MPRRSEAPFSLIGKYLADWHSLDTTQTKLQVLYAKQGRSQQFATQAARDKFLKDEIKSLETFEKTQRKHVEDLRNDVEMAKKQLQDVVQRSEAQEKGEVEKRDNLRRMGEEVVELKKKVDQMQEQRK